jgi:hypothetical protein
MEQNESNTNASVADATVAPEAVEIVAPVAETPEPVKAEEPVAAAPVAPTTDPLLAKMQELSAKSGLSLAQLNDMFAALVAAKPAAATPVAKPAAAKQTAHAGESKENFVDADDPFAKKFGITGAGGRFISRSYTKAYVECNCRPAAGFNDQPGMTRKQLFDYFSSDEYIAECVAAGVTTGSGIGKRAALDTRWNRPAKVEKPKAAAKPAAAKPAVAPTPAAAVPAIPTDLTAVPDQIGSDLLAFVANLTTVAVTDAPAPEAPAPEAPAMTQAEKVASNSAARNTRRERLAQQAADAVALRKSLEVEAPAAA